MEEMPISIPEASNETAKKALKQINEDNGEKPEKQNSGNSSETEEQSAEKSGKTTPSVDFSLDDVDVSLKEQSREDIIAAAEAAAFAEQE